MERGWERSERVVWSGGVSEAAGRAGVGLTRLSTKFFIILLTEFLRLLKTFIFFIIDNQINNYRPTLLFCYPLITLTVINLRTEAMY